MHKTHSMLDTTQANQNAQKYVCTNQNAHRPTDRRMPRCIINIISTHSVFTWTVLYAIYYLYMDQNKYMVFMVYV